MRRVHLDARSAHAVLLTCLVGCGGPREAAVYTVAGTLTVGGEPAANAMVAFHPLDQSGSPPTLAVASTGPDGTFHLMTYAASDGAPAGEYAVTVVWPDHSQLRDECVDEVEHDRFKGRYADPAKSPWRVTVGPGMNEVTLRAASPAGVAMVPDGRPRFEAVGETLQGDGHPPGEAVESGFVPPDAGNAAGPTRRCGR